MKWASMRWLLAAVLALHAYAKSDEPKVEYTDFDNPPVNLFYFEDSDTVLHRDVGTGKVWLSEDAGFKWETIDKLKGILEVVKHPYDNKVAVALSQGTQHYITKDQAKSWQSFETTGPVEHTPRTLSFHASDPDRILIQATDCLLDDIMCAFPVYYTLDGFDTEPELLYDDPLFCMWAKTTQEFTTNDKELDKNRVVCRVQGEFTAWTADSRILISDDFFRSKGEEPLLEDDRPVSGIVSVAAVTGYLAAAVKSKGSKELALYVTPDTINWHRAEFGNHTIQEDAYTILESTNYSMQVDVLISDTASLGALFTSDSNGTHFTENIRNTNRNKPGYVDFEKISNIPGIVLVNQVSNAQKVEKGADPEVITLISFDDGRNWEPLKLGKEKDGKHIHLHSVTDQRNSGRVFSSPAPGIIMGVGNTGDHLKKRKNGDTFVSDDAGLTWREALKGPHMYEMGDAGSILVAIEDENADEIKWSLNHGKDWSDMKLDHKVNPLALTTTPDSSSLKFLMIAEKSKASSKGSFEIIAFDFEGLHEDKCKDRDFEDWPARLDADGNPSCLMGRTLTFHRRKSDADCFVENVFADPVAQYEQCKCQEQDFECDFGFSRNGTAGECLPDGPLTPPKGACKGDDETYKGSSGYRLIPGNECDIKGGLSEKLDPVDRPCDETTTPPPSGDIKAELTPFKHEKIEHFYYLERCEKCKGTDETIVALTDKHVVYISHDHGKTWTPLDVKEDIVAIYPHQYINDQVFFLTSKKTVYYSKDRAQHIYDFDVPEAATQKGVAMSFHPEQSEWIIWFGDKSGQKVSHVATKFGGNWDLLMRDVGKCDFVYREGRAENATSLIYCEELKDAGESKTLVASDDFFKTKQPLKDDVVAFATMAEYIVVAVRDEKRNLKVDASIDGKVFADAHFPKSLEVAHNSAYTVLDSNTHAIFLHVTTQPKRGAEYGSIVKSNSNGTDYVLAIEAVNRNEDGYVDFEKVQGLEGVALINVVDNVKEAGDGGDKKLKTMITHNDAAEFTLIARPTSGTTKSDWCSGNLESCSLHLHGFTERAEERNSFSSPTATGLLIGNGNVGEYLEALKESDTFMSSDGGIEWQMIAEGRWAWAFGDRGSIIVIVPRDKASKELQYSLDEGATWTAWPFADNAMDIEDITTVPSDTSRNFLIWGSIDGEQVTVNVDFTGLKSRSEKCVLDEKDTESKDDDYYLWSPSHPTQETNCLFGHVAQYHRKILSKDCYNGPILPTFHKIEKHCECTRQDFECDYNFERRSDGRCELAAGLQPLDPLNECYNNRSLEEYHETSGYRRIAMTTCVNGKQMDYGMTKACPGHQDDFNKKHGISGAGLFFAIVLPIAAASAIGWYVWRNWDGKFGRIQLGNDGAIGSRIGLGGAFERDAPWVKYPVLAVSAVITIVVAIPMVVSTVWRTLSTRFGRSGGRYGTYGGRPFTSRGSFQRGRGNYAIVDDDEGELLGDEDEET